MNAIEPRAASRRNWSLAQTIPSRRRDGHTGNAVALVMSNMRGTIHTRPRR